MKNPIITIVYNHHQNNKVVSSPGRMDKFMTKSGLPWYPFTRKVLSLIIRTIAQSPLLSVLSKIYEKVLYKSMYKFLSSNDLSMKNKMVFGLITQPNHSLICVTENDDTGVFVYLEKAFEKLVIL